MKRIILYIICPLVLLASCKKIIEVGTPANQLTTDKVFSDTTSATAALLSAYAIFNVSVDPNYNKYIDLYTDELNYSGSSSATLEFLLSKVTVVNVNNQNIWSNLYFAIYQCNDMIAQLKNSTVLPPSAVTSLSAESKFLRAYAYFYLINLYGHIPLILTTDVNANAKAVQTDSATVYQQIISDLKGAQNGLTIAYPSPGRARANKLAATALLAKVYLFQGDWADAEIQAASVINSGLYTPLQAPSTVFLANSQETILSFATVNGYIADGPNLIPNSGVPQYPVTSALLNAFEAGDLRKSSWLKSINNGGNIYYYPYKYHNRTANTNSPEYLMALRAGEQYLIKAEAEANGAGNGINGAIADLNVIRSRAGLPDYTGATDKGSLLNAIYHERQIELFAENGNRFLDLKRTGRINAILSAYKSTWVPTAELLPIPQNEITFDSNLKQNAGY